MLFKGTKKRKTPMEVAEFLDKIVGRTELAYAKISVLEDLLCGATEVAIGQGIDKLIRQGNGVRI